MKKPNNKVEGNLLLSADSEVGLYQASQEILDNFDQLLKDFFKWKKTNSYTEELFVKFLKNRMGQNSIKFIRYVGGYYGGPNRIILDGVDITNQFENCRWFNF